MYFTMMVMACYFMVWSVATNLISFLFYFFLSFFGVNPNVRFSRKQFLKETLFESVSISRVYILHVLSMMYIIINIMAWRVY